MPAKTQRIYELMINTSKALSQDYKVWQIFLNTATWQYKYPFNDQLLIFAQRPDAKACARIDVWNNTMHRWVNRGSKGIALLRENGNRMGLEYVFDVSDTHSRRGNNVRLWKYDESHEDAVIETLENTFGELKVKTTIYDAVLCAAHNAVQDNKVDYLNELKYVKRDSFLSGLDNVNLDLRFRQTAEASVAYMILERMGLEPENMLDYAEFEYIRDFNTPETMNILGSAVSAISEDALRSISQTIRAEEKIKKFAKKENSVYNKSEKNIDIVNKERNEENGRSSIQDSRRLSDTRLDSTDGGTHDRQIRNDAQDVFERTPQAAVLNTDDEGRTDEPLGGNRQDGDGAGGENRVADGESGGRYGTDESERPIEMDRADEQFSSFGRGNRVIGNGVQLSIFDIPLPSEEEQKNMIEQAERNNIRPAFSMPQQVIDEVLTSGANKRDTILDIGVQYSKGKSDNIEFLKDHYGTGGKGFIFNDNKVSVWWNADGMRIAYGDTAIGKGQLLSWEQVDARIGELLELGRYAPQETLDKLDNYERTQAATSFYEMYRDTNRDEYPELKEHFNTEWFSGSYPDTIDRISELFKQSENVDFAISVTQKMSELYANNKNVMRFRYYSPDKVLPVIKDLQLEHKHFISDITVNPPQQFITEDEIDKLIIGDTQYNTPKIERYLYFKEHTDIKERVNFLKSQYHTGGVASGLFSYNYDSKGMSFSRGDIFLPFAKVNMTWRNVANRIDKLIKSGRYLNERELAEDLPKYLSAQEQLKIRGERIQFLNNTENLTPQERQQTLPKRLFYYINTIDLSDKRKFDDGGLPELINSNELEIADFIKDGDKRQQLIGCLRTIQSKTGDVHTRSNAYWIANDLEAVKIINLQKVGDFYEVYDDEAVQAAEALDITLTRKYTENGDIPMAGFPAHVLEKYAQVLNDNGYIITFTDDNKEQEKKYDIGFGMLGNGTTVWNRLEEVNHDYKTIAHISVEGDVTYYEELPDDIKQRIENVAAADKAKYEEGTFRDTIYGDANYKNNYKFEYQLLNRLQQDCEYFLGAGGRNEKHLWAGNVQDQIAKMRELYAMLPEKPEWLSEQDIDRYENEMLTLQPETDLTDEQIDNFDDVNPAEIKANLEKYGIVNGELVDPDALDKSPFIQQVMKDTEQAQQNEPKQTQEQQDEPYTVWVKNVISEYLEEEENTTADFSNLRAVNILDTVTDEAIHHLDEMHSLRVDADLIDFKINRYIDDILIDSRPFEQFLDDFSNLSFGEMVGFTDEQIQQIKEKDNIQEPTEDYSQYIGREITVDDRKFVVDSINADFGSVSLRDITFQESVSFPIFRSESIEWLKSIIKEQETEKQDAPPKLTTETEAIYPAEENNMPYDIVIEKIHIDEEKSEKLIPNIKRPRPVQNTVVYPEIPMSERHNFKIQNDELGHGTPSEKYQANITAIRTLKQLEADHRLATSEEQEILSRYVGWGGLADCFDEKHSKYGELKSLLTDEEYTAARESTLTAFYTPPVVIRSIYKALSNMGFSQGNILDPAAGVGNFEGMLPDNMTGSRVYGIELDKISGRIAQQLYQKNSIAIQGYEDTTLPDSFFDIAVGNVPFGNFKVLDKKYNKHNFLIHDYFFAKTLDKVRPGGVVAFITSSGTMDKRNSNVRKYIAQRADLVGAIRLPNNTFKANAGTEVTSDILFLQKRDRMTDILPEWVHVGTDDNGHTINQYFIDNPDMVLGDITDVSGPFGMQTVCLPYEGADLAELLDGAIQNINTQITEYEFDDISNDEDMSIPADPDVKNFSFTIVDGDIYFRENSRMNKVDVSLTAANRIKGLIEIRDCVKELIEYQTLDFPDYEIKKQQYKLNNLYDNFTKKYGLINSRGNDLAFASDSSYFLLCSLEVIDENGNLERKADMFTKRTIGAKKIVTHVDTSSEALAVSIGEKAKIDMEFMSELTGKTEQEIFEDLKGVIFLNPLYGYGGNTEEKYIPADEYLSGNVRKKLEWAKKSAEQYPDDYNINVEALTAVQPKDLSASEITVRLGTTWIPIEYIKEFTFELLTPSLHAQRNIDVKYSNLTSDWNIIGKHFDRNNIKANNTYGTYRASAYKIIEDTLNLKDTRVFDYVENEKGNRVAVLNKKETMIAQQKQDAIKSAFSEWIWKSPERRERLTKIYNEKFNSIRPREYDGSHITFSGMNPEIVLRKHQQNAVARIMYGGNSLLGHVVGAGKTWTMVAAAMESKRLGLCNKSLFVVPNHLTEQWAAEFLQLYPAANILVATKKDFEMKNRKKFCGRIATGEYDAVIIGHSQFEKIPMSVVRQRTILQNQLQEITNGIIDAKAEKAENFTIKQLEKTKRSIKAKLEKLNDTSRKDDVVTFEELGVDRLFVDEAHYYKNLYLYTKMRNVGGVAQTEAQKSSDLFMKCRYLDEITGGKGTIFATGTPISNSMVELYTMQRYLQYDTLAEHDLQHFDAWASTYGETVTAIELAPEGTGYRAKTRFAKFFNLPELMAMFKEVADIQTADMLKLPVPEAEYHNVAVEPTETQREMVAQLAERAEDVRNRRVEPNIDNMLKITNDGRKLALDQRLINDMLPDEENTKVAACADNVYKIWNDTADIHGTQLVFCDLSTPKNDGKFNVYDDIKCKLIEKGIPENEIAFIHNANTEVQKKDMFAKVRSGEIRVLFGSTQKMGAGTNVQKHLYALHDLDCPWRPSDLEQRSGRIIRQGNDNETVHIFRYVTKDTFDAYLYQLVENKQKFISQIMTSKSPVRSAEDIDETALSYAEIKSLATGNPHIKEKMDLDMQVAKLKVIKSNFMTQKYELEDKVIKYYPSRIKELTERISGMEKDIKVVEENPKIEDKFNPMTIDGLGYFEKKKAGAALIDRCKKMTAPDPVVIGEYRGFTMILSFDTIYNEHKLTLQNAVSYSITLGSDEFGNIQRIDNALADIASKKTEFEQTLTDTKNQFEFAKTESKKEFPQEAELKEKMSRLAALDALLNMDKRGNDGVVMDEPDDADMPKKKNRDMER